jgi:hypothetical protein
LAVRPWLTCRFVTFLGMDELRLLPTNQSGIIPVC